VQATRRSAPRSKRHSMRSAAPTCASWSTSSALARALGWAVISAAIAGCTASADDVHPPRDQMFFPTGLAISPSEHALFVANANSDQRYDSGSIGVINIDTVEAMITDWEARTSDYSPPTGCSIDPDHRETLVCDEAQFFDSDAGVRIGNFASDLAVQRYSQNDKNSVRLFVPTRGDPSIAWADYIANRLTCTTTSDAFALCDDAHRLVSLQNDPDLDGLASEPFSVFADSENGFAMVTHVLTGSVTLIRSQPGGQDDRVAIVDARHQQFAVNANLVSSASSIAGRIPLNDDGTPKKGDDIVYVGSTTEHRIQTYTVGMRDNAAAFLLPGNYFFLDAVGQSSGSSSTQALQFSPGGDQLYLVNRLPPSIQIYDTSTGPTGVPRNALQGASDICQQASKLTVLGDGDRERAYVTCFQDGQIYVIDPRGSSQVEDVISVGRGPYGVAATTGMLTGGKPRLFVSNFFEDTVAVIDLADGANHNRVVLRIGKPKAQ